MQLDRTKLPYIHWLCFGPSPLCLLFSSLYDLSQPNIIFIAQNIKHPFPGQKFHNRHLTVY